MNHVILPTPKRNIPFNLARMIWSIVSEETTKDQRLTELKIYLSAQIYPEKLIDSSIEEAKNIPQNILRTTRKKDPFLILFVTNYNPKHVKIFQEATFFFSDLAGSRISITDSLVWLTP